MKKLALAAIVCCLPSLGGCAAVIPFLAAHASYMPLAVAGGAAGLATVDELSGYTLTDLVRSARR